MLLTVRSAVAEDEKAVVELWRTYNIGRTATGKDSHPPGAEKLKRLGRPMLRSERRIIASIEREARKSAGVNRPMSRFKKGTSGNPGGRPKLLQDVRDLAREYT
jgi:hypothetical protein